MDITSQYDLGQKVWRLYQHRESIKLPCTFCRGQRRIRVDAPSGNAYAHVDCPDCKGRGEIALASVPKWEAAEGPMTIGQVRVTVTQSAGRDGEHRFDNYKPQEGREETYMCVETGIGSGSLHDVEKLYASLPDAQDAADELNEGIFEGRGWKPDYHEAQTAQAFLDHRDIYEHEPEHVELAQKIVVAFEHVDEPAESMA